MGWVDDGQIHIAADHGLLALVVGNDQEVDLVDIGALLAEIGLGDKLGAGAEAVEAYGLAFQIPGRADARILAHEVLHMRCLLQRLAAGGNHLHVGPGRNGRNHQRHHARAEMDVARADQRNDLGGGNLAHVVGAGGGPVEVAQSVGQIDQVERGVVGVVEGNDLAIVCRAARFAAGLVVGARASRQAQGCCTDGQKLAKRVATGSHGSNL